MIYDFVTKIDLKFKLTHIGIETYQNSNNLILIIKINEQIVVHYFSL